MTSQPKRSWGRWAAAGTVTLVLGAVGILIAGLPPLKTPTIITGFVIVILAVVLGLAIVVRQGPANDAREAPVPLTRRIRRAFYGRRSSDSDRLGSALRSTGRVGVGILGPTPGPFDNPPEEDVELDPAQLPWELRDASETDRAHS